MFFELMMMRDGAGIFLHILACLFVVVVGGMRNSTRWTKLYLLIEIIAQRKRVGDNSFTLVSFQNYDLLFSLTFTDRLSPRKYPYVGTTVHYVGLSLNIEPSTDS